MEDEYIDSLNELSMHNTDNTQLNAGTSTNDNVSPLSNSSQGSQISKKIVSLRMEMFKLIFIISLLVAAIFILVAVVLFAVILGRGVNSMTNSEGTLIKENIATTRINITFLIATVQTLKKYSVAIRLNELNASLSAGIRRSKLILSELKTLSEDELSRAENELNRVSSEQSISRMVLQTRRNDSITLSELITIFVDLSKNVGQTYTSCSAIQQLTESPDSGNYSLWSSSLYAFNAYCNMTRSCGGVTGGWMTVYSVDLSVDSLCPEGLMKQLRTTYPFRLCRISHGRPQSCTSTMLPVRYATYSKVCGRVIAYQYADTDAFGSISEDIDTFYVDGVSITHGMSPRQHIWTFAAAISEDTRGSRSKCPCINTNIVNPIYIPSFVGNDYFCDTASLTGFQKQLYTDDPLWDGAGCGPNNTCCSFNNPPWFYKELPKPTADDIEMRVCRDEDRFNEDIELEVVDIFVR